MIYNLHFTNGNIAELLLDNHQNGIVDEEIDTLINSSKESHSPSYSEKIKKKRQLNELIMKLTLDYSEKGKIFSIDQLAAIGEYIPNISFLTIIDIMHIRISRENFKKVEKYITPRELFNIENRWSIDSSKPKKWEIQEAIYASYIGLKKFNQLYNELLRIKNDGMINIFGILKDYASYKDNYYESIKHRKEDAEVSLLWIKREIRYIVCGIKGDVMLLLNFLESFPSRWEKEFVHRKRVNMAINLCKEIIENIKCLYDELQKFV